MSTAKQYKRYPLDLTGNHPDNRVMAEVHSITPQERIFNVMAGAFYTESVQITYLGEQLTAHEDFRFHRVVEDAIRQSGKDVAMLIEITDKSVSGDIEVRYQAVGGEFQNIHESLVDMLENYKHDARGTFYKDIIEKPRFFEPVRHLTSIYDIYGLNPIAGPLNELVSIARHRATKENSSLLIRLHRIEQMIHDADLGNLDLSGIANLRNELNQVKKQVADVDITALTQSFNALKSALESQISGLTEKVDAALPRAITEVTTNVTKADEKAQQALTKATSTEQALNQFKQDGGSVTREVNFGTNMEGAFDKVGPFGFRLVISGDKRIGGLTTEIEDVKRRLEEATTKLAGVDTKIAQAADSARLQAVESKASQLESSLSVVTGTTIPAINNDIQSQGGRIAVLMNTIATNKHNADEAIDAVKLTAEKARDDLANLNLNEFKTTTVPNLITTKVNELVTPVSDKVTQLESVTIPALDTKITTETEKVKTALEGEIAKIKSASQSDASAVASRLDAFEPQVNDRLSKVEVKANKLEKDLEEFNDAATQTVFMANGYTDRVKRQLEKQIQDVNTKVSAVDGTITGAIKPVKDKVDRVESIANAAKSEINEMKQAQVVKDTAQDGRLAELERKIGSAQAAAENGSSLSQEELKRVEREYKEAVKTAVQTAGSNADAKIQTEREQLDGRYVKGSQVDGKYYTTEKPLVTDALALTSSDEFPSGKSGFYNKETDHGTYHVSLGGNSLSFKDKPGSVSAYLTSSQGTTAEILTTANIQNDSTAFTNPSATYPVSARAAKEYIDTVQNGLSQQITAATQGIEALRTNLGDGSQYLKGTYDDTKFSTTSTVLSKPMSIVFPTSITETHSGYYTASRMGNYDDSADKMPRSFMYLADSNGGFVLGFNKLPGGNYVRARVGWYHDSTFIMAELLDSRDLVHAIETNSPQYKPVSVKGLRDYLGSQLSTLTTKIGDIESAVTPVKQQVEAAGNIKEKLDAIEAKAIADKAELTRAIDDKVTAMKQAAASGQPTWIKRGDTYEAQDFITLGTMQAPKSSKPEEYFAGRLGTYYSYNTYAALTIPTSPTTSFAIVKTQDHTLFIRPGGGTDHRQILTSMDVEGDITKYGRDYRVPTVATVNQIINNRLFSESENTLQLVENAKRDMKATLPTFTKDGDVFNAQSVVTLKPKSIEAGDNPETLFAGKFGVWIGSTQSGITIPTGTTESVSLYVFPNKDLMYRLGGQSYKVLTDKYKSTEIEDSTPNHNVPTVKAVKNYVSGKVDATVQKVGQLDTKLTQVDNKLAGYDALTATVESLKTSAGQGVNTEVQAKFNDLEPRVVKGETALTKVTEIETKLSKQFRKFTYKPSDLMPRGTYPIRDLYKIPGPNDQETTITKVENMTVTKFWEDGRNRANGCFLTVYGDSDAILNGSSDFVNWWITGIDTNVNRTKLQNLLSSMIMENESRCAIGILTCNGAIVDIYFYRLNENGSTSTHEITRTDIGNNTSLTATPGIFSYIRGACASESFGYRIASSENMISGGKLQARGGKVPGWEVYATAEDITASRKKEVTFEDGYQTSVKLKDAGVFLNTKKISFAGGGRRRHLMVTIQSDTIGTTVISDQVRFSLRRVTDGQTLVFGYRNGSNMIVKNKAGNELHVRAKYEISSTAFDGEYQLVVDFTGLSSPAATDTISHICLSYQNNSFDYIPSDDDFGATEDTDAFNNKVQAEVRRYIRENMKQDAPDLITEKFTIQPGAEDWSSVEQDQYGNIRARGVVLQNYDGGTSAVFAPNQVFYVSETQTWTVPRVLVGRKAEITIRAKSKLDSENNRIIHSCTRRAFVTLPSGTINILAGELTSFGNHLTVNVNQNYPDALVPRVSVTKDDINVVQEALITIVV
nr:MAG TPA: structural protein [Caudoviricetes sp.]